MNLQIALNAAGGLALFLLAMLMMTEGLKVFAGRGLKQLLGRWTSTPVRGVFAGMLVTGVVQSSSAVTVATIGFVNAGLLTLREGLGVIFGTNVGTTMTGWLVSLVGFGLRIEAFALPMLTVGVVLRLMAQSKRRQGLGEALAGFGLFFLGLAMLKDAFGGLAGVYGATLADGVIAGRLTFVLVGFVATVLTQSSSAAIAIILTAAAGGVVAIEPAAAAVIGANLGTTSTAAIAVIKATPGAKRLAIGHIVFNLVTGAIALALLPLVLWLVARVAGWLDVAGSPAAFLALFHTLFNVLGVLIMLPLANRLAGLLERMFRSAEEDLGRAQHLDSTLTALPALAVAALREELLRLRAIVTGIAQGALAGKATAPVALERQADAARQLGAAVANFAASVRAGVMSEDVAEELARAIRTGRYLVEAARLAPQADALRTQAARITDADTRAIVMQAVAAAAGCLVIDEHPVTTSAGDTGATAVLPRFGQAYERAKTAVLAAAVARRLSTDAAEALLDALSATRRLVEQLLKANRALRSPGVAAAAASGHEANSAAAGSDPDGDSAYAPARDG
ncbi:MAG: Na/Pi cotransporter family protein [Gammaproteobacteria bacterium]|nr:Na/Pi cotransporter family protein [Gammaproteobacteria bacterium]